jgi:23S rRNA pseudouridine2605 synthase
VLDLVNSAELKERGVRLYPVGRLDADTTGLMLLTNDGELTFRLTHPRFGVEKEYRALVRGTIPETALEKLRSGVEIEGERTAPARAAFLSKSEGNSFVKIVIHEGRKRQVRLMLAAVGHPALELERVKFGTLSLGDLEAGRWRYLAQHEVHSLRKAARLAPGADGPAAGGARARQVGRRVDESRSRSRTTVARTQRTERQSRSRKPRTAHPPSGHNRH